MRLLSDDPITQLAFSVYENKKVFALLLGSGLSRAAEIPTGWEITLDLIRRVALAQGIEEQTDWAQWYRGAVGEEPNYSTLLEELALSPEERRSVLHGYIEPTETDREEGRKLPTRAHLAIADLVRAGFIRVIITTNFDRLMENALRERGVEPTIVASTDALIGAAPIIHSACYILKLHGDYKDARILNTDVELGAYPPEYDRLLDRILDEHGLIVAGWSGEWDHALRAAILRAPNRRYPTYWAARGALGEGANELVTHRGARITPISDADGFFSGLNQTVETIAQTHRQNPLGVELLVSSAKRFLAKPELRIQLDVLFAEQTERLIARLDATAFDPNGKWHQDEFRRRVASYEAATEPLAKMAGALGRWATGGDLPLMLDIIRTLYADAEKIGGGNTVWLGLRSYPAVLIFTAYGLGLVRSDRWKVFGELSAAPIANEHRKTHPVIETFFLWDWKGWSQNELWQQLEGLHNHKTAFSDRLSGVYAEWAKSFAGITPDFDLLFDRFEALCSLSHLRSATEAELDKHLSGAESNDVRMPVGRTIWASGRRSQLIEEMRSAPMREAIIDAGLAPSANYIRLFARNLERVARRLDR